MAEQRQATRVSGWIPLAVVAGFLILLFLAPALDAWGLLAYLPWVRAGLLAWMLVSLVSYGLKRRKAPSSGLEGPVERETPEPSPVQWSPEGLFGIAGLGLGLG